ncbi:MAG TPA: glycoside hydrolase family 65 protein [Firmicutes bacterium]|nr:glycoside hydrolase family 65 protein [Bacillota bacterium]
MGNEWLLSYNSYVPEEERLRETLTAVGNGYFASRGSFPGSKFEGSTHYPGTYIANVYNKIPTRIYGKDIYNNDLVNCPNWLPVYFSLDGSDVINPLKQKMINYRHALNIKEAFNSREMVFEHQGGKKTALKTKTAASMKRPHLAALYYSITPQNYSGEVEITAALDGTVANMGVERYRKLNNKHLAPVEERYEHEGALLITRTTASKIKIFTAAKCRITCEGKPVDFIKKKERKPGYISEKFIFDAKEGKEYVLEKAVCIYTSQDTDSRDPEKDCISFLEKDTGFDEIKEENAKEWENLWNAADIRIKGDDFAQKSLRLHAYHLLVTASRHNIHIQAGLPARGLHGEAYRGHVFWDELFTMSFYTYTFPSVCRGHLMYRYKLLDAARDYARENGYEGAMFPWQTADTGEEETQVIHYNPVSEKWDPDLSRRQRHVSIAIGYNVLRYLSVSGDEEFFHKYGAEMMIEIARFWASIARKEEDGRYHIKGVMGPDEFHEKYPDSEEPGLNDNAYTNITAGWFLERAAELVRELPKEVIESIRKKIGFDARETDKWLKTASNIYVPMKKDGLIEQFEGFMNLKEIDFGKYSKKHGDISRMDRILKAEDDTPDRYQVIKQADVLMTFYVVPLPDVLHTMQKNGYDIENPYEFLKTNYDYYLKRCSHGSTLSYIIHAHIMKDMPESRQQMFEFFRRALESDIYDTQGGTTAEAIHCGVMAGTIKMAVEVFGGITIRQGEITVNPALPDQWEGLEFQLKVHGAIFDFSISREAIRVKASMSGDEKVKIVIAGNFYPLEDGNEVEVPY